MIVTPTRNGDQVVRCMDLKEHVVARSDVARTDDVTERNAIKDIESRGRVGHEVGGGRFADVEFVGGMSFTWRQGNGKRFKQKRCAECCKERV